METLCWKFDFIHVQRKKFNRNIAWLYKITKQIQHLFLQIQCAICCSLNIMNDFFFVFFLFRWAYVSVKFLFCLWLFVSTQRFNNVNVCLFHSIPLDFNVQSVHLSLHYRMVENDVPIVSVVEFCQQFIVYSWHKTLLEFYFIALK